MKVCTNNNDNLAKSLFQKYLDEYAEILASCGNELTACGLCIIAHGASSSGKTHSILGDPADNKNSHSKGILFFVLEALRKLTDCVDVSVCEVYNESYIYHKWSCSREQSDTDQWYRISSANHVSECIALIKSFRRQASTPLNPYSSRSHMVIQIVGFSGDTSIAMQILDLAGSEKMSTYRTEHVAEKQRQVSFNFFAKV